jgi:hypothetical protein
MFEELKKYYELFSSQQETVTFATFMYSGIVEIRTMLGILQGNAGYLLFASTNQMVQKSVNMKYSLVLTGIFRFKPKSQFVEQYYSIVSCALNMEDPILKNFCKFSK